MTKPDWAERLQRTFRRKYSEGFSAGVQAERERIIRLMNDKHAVVTEPVSIGSDKDPIESHWSHCVACYIIDVINEKRKDES